MTDPNTASNIIASVSGTVGSSLIIYITVLVRKGIRKYLTEHEWLLQQTRENTEAIRKNTAEIRRILDIMERRLIMNEQSQRRGRY